MARPRSTLSEGRVSLRKRSKYYSARWSEGNGQREVSLKVTNLEVAKQLARQISNTMENGEPWEWVLGETRPSEQTFSQVVNEYLERGSRWSETTRQQNKSTVSLLLREFGDLPVSKGTRHGIEGFLARRRDDGLSTASRNRYLCALKVILAKAEEWAYIRENPAAALKCLPEGKKLPRPYTADEIDRILPEMEDRHRGIAEIYLHTGMRKGELIKLLWSDVDFSARTITVRSPKNQRDRAIPMSTRVFEILNQRRQEWQSEQTDKRVKDVRVYGPLANIRQAVRRAWARAGIDEERCQVLRPLHAFRDTNITRLVEAGVPLDRVQTLAGHASVEMTRRYAETREESLREAVATVFG